MKIGVDVMGGDFSPKLTTLGAILAQKQLPSDVELVLYGDKEQILEIFKEEKFEADNISIHHTTEIIEMGEHPAKAFKHKHDSSIFVGFQELMLGETDGFCSAGNTGAMLVGAMHTVKQIPGIIRPAIAASFPKINGGNMVVCDVGINMDSKPDVLYQYAILGSLYCANRYNVKNPRVGLLNVGSEEEKGNLLTRSAYELMKDSKDFNFVGNIEGSDFFNEDTVDVVITDGFTGNILLKNMESFYPLIKKLNIQDSFLDRFDSSTVGGSSLLGVNSTVVIGHGSANEIAIKNMILHTYNMVETKIISKIKDAFK